MRVIILPTACRGCAAPKGTCGGHNWRSVLCVASINVSASTHADIRSALADKRLQAQIKRVTGRWKAGGSDSGQRWGVHLGSTDCAAVRREREAARSHSALSSHKTYSDADRYRSPYTYERLNIEPARAVRWPVTAKCIPVTALCLSFNSMSPYS